MRDAHHNAKHNGSKSVQFLCKWCGRSYAYKSGLLRHTCKKTSNVEKTDEAEMTSDEKNISSYAISEFLLIFLNNFLKQKNI